MAEKENTGSPRFKQFLAEKRCFFQAGAPAFRVSPFCSLLPKTVAEGKGELACPLVDPPAGRSLPHLFPGPLLCPLHHPWGCISSYRVSGQGWPLPLESPGERSSRVSHGESTILPLPGRLPPPSARRAPASMIDAISEEVTTPGDFNGDFVMFCLLLDPSVGLVALGVSGVPILFSRTQTLSPPLSRPFQNLSLGETLSPFLFLSGRNLSYAISQVTHGREYNLMLRLTWLRS